MKCVKENFRNSLFPIPYSLFVAKRDSCFDTVTKYRYSDQTIVGTPAKAVPRKKRRFCSCFHPKETDMIRK